MLPSWHQCVCVCFSASVITGLPLCVCLHAEEKHLKAFYPRKSVTP